MRIRIVRSAALVLALTSVAFAQRASSGDPSKQQVHLDLGLFTDFYGDTVLIEFIDRVRYPVVDFPFQPGDELFSIGGMPVAVLMQGLESNLIGSPAFRQRLAADQLTYPPQSSIADPSNPPASDVVIRRASSGALEFYHLNWVATNVTNSGRGTAPDTLDLKYLEDRRLQDENGQWVTRNDLLGWGRTAPHFKLPAGFQILSGANPGDKLYSGRFDMSGRQIGYIRIANFSSPDFDAAIAGLDDELDFLRENTDGLIVDLSRNAGGECPVNALAQRLLLSASPFEAIRNSAKARTAPACGSTVVPVFEAKTVRVPPYSKPVIFLTDELSVGSSEDFLTMMQVSDRGPLVGTATAGLKVISSDQPQRIGAPPLHQTPISTEFTAAPVVADVEINIMTRENLLNGGRDFLGAVTSVILNEISKARALPVVSTDFTLHVN